jgi:pyruvate kinase
VQTVLTMREICAEAESYLNAGAGDAGGRPARLSGLIDPTTAACVDAACLMAHQLDAALIVVATESGRTALALSNRRPAAAILALPRTERVARSLALCRGITSVVFAETAPAERVLSFAIDWAKSHGLIRLGERAVLLQGQIADRPNIRGVLAGTVS